MSQAPALLAVLAEPTRFRILEQLLLSERSVGELVDTLEMSQPAVSKHLRVMRESGLVSSRVEAQRRIYRIEPHPLQALDGWLERYLRLWTHHLDALGRHLDRKESI